MDLWVKNFIQANPNPNKATHFYAPTKSYLHIPGESESELWTKYCSAVNESKNPCLYEYVGNQKAVQLGFDLNLKFERQHIPSQQDVILELTESIDDYAKYIISVIQMLIQHYFESTTTNMEIVTCYLRRDDDEMLVWTDNTIEYTGRLIFPYARIAPEYVQRMYHFLISHLQLQSGSIEEYLTHTPINGLDTLIKPISSEVVEMFGSSNYEGTCPLTWYQFYGHFNSDIDPKLGLEAVFRTGYHSAIKNGFLTQEIIETYIREYGSEFWLPLIFSSGYHNESLIIKDGIPTSEPEAPQITMTVIREGGETLNNLEQARQLINYLDVGRANSYWSWIDVGQSLHSVDSGIEGLNLWKWFTSQSDFKDDDDCDGMWYTFEENDHVNLETLEFFVYEDNPEAYHTLHSKEIDEAIDNALNMPEHTPIAKAFQKCFPHEFVCADYQNNIWYYYNKHRWVQFSGNWMLMYYINEKFQVKLEEKRAELSAKNLRSKDAAFKARNNTTMDLIGELMRKLSQNGFKDNVCKELKIYYYKEHFNKVRDMGKYFMSTPNCVLDFRGGEGIARPGKPQDYITKQTSYAFPETFTWDSKPVKDTMNYLSQVFRQRTLREYFIRLLASLLVSGNNDKIFPIWSGAGDNSKSILVRLIETSFGGYSVKLPTSLITEKRTGADAATPSVIHSRGAKVAFLQEPNEREVIQSGTVKEITGNDSMYVRDLFQKGSAIVEMDITMVPILVANKIPVIPDCQQAIWNRTRVLNFLSKWSSDAPDDEKEQFLQGIFKMDKFFDRNVKTMAPALLWIAFQSYADYYENGLNDPHEVLEATENFRVANNFYIHFTRDSITSVLKENGEPDNSAFVTLDELFNTFKTWYKDQQFRAKMPTKTDFKDNLENVWKQKADGSDNRWYGIKLNNLTTNIQSILSF